MVTLAVLVVSACATRAASESAGRRGGGYRERSDLPRPVPRVEGAGPFGRGTGHQRRPRGLTAAIDRHFQGASWQRCQVHFARNLLGMVGCQAPGPSGEPARDFRGGEAGDTGPRPAPAPAHRWARVTPRWRPSWRRRSRTASAWPFRRATDRACARPTASSGSTRN